MIDAYATDIILLLLIATAVLVALCTNLFIATITTGIFSLLIAILFVILDAPDVAFTEAAVGAGASTILFLAAIALTRQVKSYEHKRYLSALLLVTFFFALVIYSIPDLPRFADTAAVAHQHVGKYYLDNTAREIGIPNVVTAVLASYRGFDTLGELIIIFTAGMGVIGIFAMRRRKQDHGNNQT